VTGVTSGDPLRIGRVLDRIPAVDVLTTFRSVLIASSRARTADAYHLTLSNRVVNPEHLAELVPKAVKRFGKHLHALLSLTVQAIEEEEAGAPGDAVRTLLRAVVLERGEGRERAAEAWIAQALLVAAAVPDRRPEVDALLAWGDLEIGCESFERAARHLQRAFTLADAERDDARVATACYGLGVIAAQRLNVRGASAWYSRGLAAAAKHSVPNAWLHVGMARLEESAGDFGAARDRLHDAEEDFRAHAEWSGVATALTALARLHAATGASDDALALFREALAHARRRARVPVLELDVRLDLCRHLLATGQLVVAEDEVRRAEEVAIRHGLVRSLARLYLILGAIRTAQSDETGFIFFEKALDLSRQPEPVPLLEAEAYRGYSAFRHAMGEEELAIACAEREREILVQRVTADSSAP